jgi:hypothetical protein
MMEEEKGEKNKMKGQREKREEEEGKVVVD